MTLALLAGEAPAFLTEIVALVAVGAAIAYVCHRLGLLPIVGFLLTGVAIGPNALGLVYEPTGRIEVGEPEQGGRPGTGRRSGDHDAAAVPDAVFVKDCTLADEDGSLR